MGAGCSCERNPSNVSDPTSRNEIENQLADFLELDHPLNINRKYKMWFQIQSNLLFMTFHNFQKGEKYTGKGLKKTFSYSSKLPQAEILKKRTIFWETRIEGSS